MFCTANQAEPLLCHGDWTGVCAGVDDFHMLTALPAQTLTTAITEGHKFALHSDHAPGTDIIGGLPMAAWKHFQFSHWHGDTEAYQGEGHPKKQRCRTYENQLPFHVRPRQSVRQESHQKLETSKNKKEEAPFYARRLLLPDETIHLNKPLDTWCRPQTRFVPPARSNPTPVLENGLPRPPPASLPNGTCARHNSRCSRSGSSSCRQP